VATGVNRHFFNDADYFAYLELMPEWCRQYRVEAWAYCKPLGMLISDDVGEHEMDF
jgi:hypothetical protein